MVRGLRVSKNVPVNVERIPADRLKARVIAEGMRLDRNRRPRRGSLTAVCAHHRDEVLANGAAVAETDRNAVSNRQERPQAEIGDAVGVVRRVPARVL